MTHDDRLEARDAMLLRGKVVVISGAAHGIGRAIALACAEQGADVALNDIAEPAASQPVVDEIRARGRRALALQGDVADPAAAAALIDAAVAEFGGVDVCVANAGICPFQAFLEMPAELVQRTMGVNYEGTFYLAQAAAQQMKAQSRGGAIIAISSISKLVGGEFQSHYTPTKAAQHALMQSAAIALGRYGIRCNSVLPGTVVTNINQDDLTPEKTAYFEKRIPLGRLGQPGDIAGPVVFLASDLARYVTGAELLVDGGMFVNLQ